MNKSYVFIVLAGINKAGSAAADIVATVALCYQLAVSQTGMKQTDSLVKTLMQYVIQRGLLITLVQTLILIIFLGTGSHLYWLALHVNVTRLYANTFFAMLNGRHGLREKGATDLVATPVNFDSNGTQTYGQYSGVKFTTSTSSDFTHVGEKVINISKSVVAADI